MGSVIPKILFSLQDSCLLVCALAQYMCLEYHTATRARLAIKAPDVRRAGQQASAFC